MRRVLTFGMLLAASTFGIAAAAIPEGNAEQTATVGGVPLQVFTYRPVGCEPRYVMLVFHGIGRNPGPYRDHARPLADGLCATIVAPLFDTARFPRDLYQYGGVAAHGAAVPPGQRTVDLIPALVSWARAASGQADRPAILIGHSAGAQFLGRVAAFVPISGARIVLANPSTWVFPTVDNAVPFGFGGTGTPAQSEAEIRAYLARPITVLLGTADLLSKDLDVTPPAMAQGPNRYMRGRNAFSAAQAMARQHGWAFGWQVSEVPNVGHDATRMFGSPQALAALSAAVPGQAGTSAR